VDTTFAAVAARTQRAGMRRRKNTLEKLIANIHASHAFMGTDCVASTSRVDIDCFNSTAENERVAARQARRGSMKHQGVL
jgi:hypothetical protein